MKKCIKLFKTCALLVDHTLIDKIHREMKEEYLPEYDMVFQQKDEARVTSRFSKNKKKLEKIFKDDIDKNDLLERIQKQNDKYFYAQKEAQFHAKLPGMTRSEILEKYAILSYLVENHPRLYLMSSVNPFEDTVFREHF